MKFIATLATAVLALAAPVAAADTFDLGGAPKGNPTAVVYKFLGQFHVAAFVRGPLDLMYAQVGTMDGGTWTPWVPIGDLKLKGDPDCVARNEVVIDCVAVGPNNAIYWTSYASATNSWSGWASLGGFATSDPSVVRTVDGGEQLRVFVRGPANHLFLNTLDGGWSDWQDLDIVVGDKLGCVDFLKWGAHCYDSTGGSAVQLTNVTEMTGSDIIVDDVGGAVSGKVGAVSTGANGDLLRLFVRGPGNKLWANTWDEGWSDWYQIGATMKSAPSCASKKTGGDVWCASISSGKVLMTLVDSSEL